MALWWLKEHHIGKSPFQKIVVEPRASGRWYELGEDGSECEWGTVLLWDPPNRLVLGWQLNMDFKFDPALTTEVEVTFTRLGPSRRAWSSSTETWSGSAMRQPDCARRWTQVGGSFWSATPARLPPDDDQA